MKRKLKCLTVLCSMSTVAIITSWHFSESASKRTDSGTPPALRCWFSGEYWHGDRIYGLKNNSHIAMSYVTIMSWSEQILPIITITDSESSFAKSGTDSVLPPPNQLQPQQVAWFVGPRSTSSTEFFSVIWQNNGEAFYENVKDTT